MKSPSKKKCIELLNKNRTPSKVIEHSKTVCRVAEKVAERLINNKIRLNKRLVTAAALLHDIERGKDRHVIRGFRLLNKLGYSNVANTIKKHSLYKLDLKNRQPRTWEEKIVFYADKRCKDSRIVTLDERFKALESHYKVNLGKELKFTKRIEKELLQK